MTLTFATLSPDALLFALVVGHCLGDYPLQGDFLARAKNHTAPIAGVPWQLAVVSHAWIQAGIVGLITGSLSVATAEYVLHCGIDFAKSTGWFGAGERAFTIDQVLHLLCKIAWVLVVRGTL